MDSTRPAPAAPNCPYLAAARCAEPSRRPIWIMRQAGRYLPEYRAVREQMSFLELCRSPEASCEVTLQPIRRYDLDAAILFTDLLVPVIAMGVDVDYQPGPVLQRRIESASDIATLADADPSHEAIATMLAAARNVRTALDPQKALIGFVGAPFTMACYLVEGRGSKAWDDTRRFMHAEPAAFQKLLRRIGEALEPVVTALVAAGCDAIQIFDSWAGVLSADDYARHAAGPTDRLLQLVRSKGAVAVNFVNGAAQHVEQIADSSCNVAAVDWRLPIREVRRRLPDDMAVQGNLDPTCLYAPDDALRAEAARICRDAGAIGHVFNLGHGILPSVDPAKVATLVDEVRRHDHAEPRHPGTRR